MKPRVLEMSAFGPYRDRVTVPFDAFGEGGLVLVAGDTGAGKTTIFDGICFALFGESSTDVREADTLRSDFADPDTETYVRLCFTHRGKDYEIRRNPNYKRPKKRAKNPGEMTQEKADAVLTGPDGLVVAGAANVTEAVEELLRMNRKQFKQIVMIAQGEFSRMLFAKSEEKGQIFRKIFQTDMYFQFQELIKRQALEAESGWKASVSRLLQYKEMIQAEAADVRLTQLREEPSVHGIPECLAELELRIREDEVRQQRLAAEGEACQENIDRLLRESEGRRNYLDQRRRLEEAEARWQALSAREAEVSAREKQVAESESIRLEVVPLWNGWQQELAKEKDRLTRETKALRRREEAEAAKVALAKEKDPATGSYYRQFRKLAAEWESSQATYQELETKLLRAEELFFRNQAGLLATRLEAGMPCPVCGSTEHPSPAQAEAEALEESQVKLLRADRDRSRKKTEVAKDAVLAEKQKAERVLLNEQAHLEAEVAAAAEALLRLAEEKERQQRQIEEARARYEAVCGEKGFLEAEHWRGRILEEKIEQKQRRECREYRENYQAAAGAREALAKQLAEQPTDLDWNALREQEENDTKQLLFYRNQKAAIAKDEKGLYTKIQTNRQARDFIKAEWKKKEEKEELYRQWKNLADTAGGNLTGKEKLAFEAFVQAFYFRQVLEAANGRLRRMTGGRFSLVIREEAENRRQKTGLELDVKDAYTGKERTVKSLSGGETFKASLSLALGLSDVIQQMAGGIEIDAMFIDEGFGALDEESLTQAVQTLQGLTEGSRFVGIISHVRELKEQIEKQILVTRHNDGSTVELRY